MNVISCCCIVVLLLSACVVPARAQWLSFYGGTKLPQFGNSRVELTYIDESPAPESIQSTTEIKNTPYYFVGASYDHYNKKDIWYYELIANAYFGELTGFDAGFTGGYPIYLNDSASIGIIPALTAGMSFMEKPMGTLINRSTYIQVNETRFGNGQNVDVSLSRFGFFVKPSLALTYNITRNYQLRLIGAYMVDLSIDESIGFSGKDNSGKVVSDSEPIDAPNLSYTVNGKNSDTVPFDLNGLEVKLGIAIQF